MANQTACALLDNDQVKCWGYNAYGQLAYGHRNSIGDNVNEMGDFLPNIDLSELSIDTQVGVGYDHVCTLLDSFNLKCFGFAASGEHVCMVHGIMSA